MTEYDPEVIRKFADRLYSRAATIEVMYTILGALVGGGIGFAANYSLRSSQPLIYLLGLLLFGVLGYAAGSARAFLLRLQAQTALCQVQIEQNTHRGQVSEE